MKNRPRILLVDDDEGMRETLALILHQKGYETETAGTGQEAIEKARQRFFNVALLDIRLPDVTGVELLAPLRGMHPDMASIIVTGYSSVQTAVRALNEGASAYITKPLDVDEMLAVVRETLEKQRLIDDKRGAEEALRESEERYRSLFEGAEDHIFVLDQDFRYVMVNPSALKAGGFALEDVVGRGPREAFSEDADFYLSKYRQVFETGESVWFERELRLPDADRWFSVTLSPIKDAQGRVIALTGISRDVTERKRAEEALRRREQEIRLVADNAPALVSYVDSNGCYRFVNRRYEEWFEMPRTEIIGKHYREVLGEAAYEAIRDRVETALSGQRVRYEEALPYARGGSRWVIAEYVPDVDDQGQVNGFFALVTDITDRKRAEEALGRRAENLRAINELAINLTTAQPSPDHLKLIADELQSITNALAVSVSTYDPDEQALIVKYVAADGKLIARLNDLLDRGIVGFPTPVSEEHYDQIVNEIVRTAPDFHATTFGAVPRPISAAAQEMFGIDHFIGLALTDGDKLMGTSVLVIPSGQAPPSEEIVETFARVAGASLRQRRAEEALRRRRQEMVTLLEISRQLTGKLDLDALLDGIVNAVMEILPAAEATSLWLYNEKRNELVIGAWKGHKDEAMAGLVVSPDVSLVGLVCRTRRPQIIHNVAREPAFERLGISADAIRSVIGVPLMGEENLLGVLFADSYSRTHAFDEHDLRLLHLLGNQGAIAIRNSQLYEAEHAAREQLRDLTSYLQDAREEERKRISREIHDELGQTLTALRFDLSRLAKRLPEGEPALRERAGAMATLIDGSMHTVRRVSTELRPGLLDDLGLAAAIEWQAEEFGERTGIRCHLHLSEEDAELVSGVATALFRILQETLTNVARHAEAGEVDVELTIDPHQTVLRVRDDGRGITESEISSPQALGLLGIRERVRALGGEVTFEGIAGQGTTVTASIPRGET